MYSASIVTMKSETANFRFFAVRGAIANVITSISIPITRNGGRRYFPIERG